jgi:branched-chain amino acid transport system permease protein
VVRVFGIDLGRWRQSLLAAGLVLLGLLPLLLDDFEVFQLTQVAVYAIAILGLNLLTGFNGQFSLGHSAFYAIGAYTAAIMMDRYEIAYYWTLPTAGALSFAAGFLFGFPALRLEGLYLALATFALAVAAPQLLKFSAFEELTGGVQGIVLSRPEPPLGLSLSEDQWLYCFTVLTMLLLFWVARNLVRGRVGRAMMAIRDNPIAASAMGVNIAYYKTLTFGISALYTGVAGALGAIAVGFVAPDSFTFLLSVTFLVGLVVGGVGSIPGAIFGGLFVLYVPNIAEGLAGEFSKGLSWAVYGLILILFIYVMPGGIAGSIRWLIMRLASRS